MCVNEYVRETVPVATDAAVVSVSSVTPPTLKISAVDAMTYRNSTFELLHGKEARNPLQLHHLQRLLRCSLAM